MKNNWDIFVAGGGLAGVSAAISAARNGACVLLIEENGFLGGCATGSLVTPMMKNQNSQKEPLHKGLYLEILEKLRNTGNSAQHTDGNPGWFNPESLKILLDELCEESKIDVLFETSVVGAKRESDRITSVNCINKAGLQLFEADFFIDATGDAHLASYAGIPTESGEHQSLTLRFTMDNVDICRLSSWLKDIEPNLELSSIDYKEQGIVLLTTAHTSEDIGWKLRPYFNLAIKNETIKPEDAEYFQIFTIPGQKNAVAFNCPRIYSPKLLNPLDPWDISYAYRQGRKQIKRLAEFCKEYLTGFEEAYISQIAPNLGIRDSRRIKGLYTLTEEDVLSGKKFPNPAASSNYPIDIHGNSKSENIMIELSEDNHYDIPAEALMTKDLSNLMVVGKCLSATFKAQASARIMPNCIAMGEFAGKYLAERIQR